MLSLKIGMILFGVLLLFLGSLILLNQKRSVEITHEGNTESSMFDRRSAKRIGLIELVGGIINVALGTLSFFFSDVFTLFASMACVFLVSIALFLNTLFVGKKN